MEKRIIPITLGNVKLHSIIKEIVEYSHNFADFELQIKEKKDLQKNEKFFLVTDDEFVIDNLQLILEFKVIFLINSNIKKAKIEKYAGEMIMFNTPLKLNEMFLGVSHRLQQIASQTARRLKFKNFIYDPVMRTLYNDDLHIRFTEKESQIFMCLYNNNGIYITKKNLLKQVWSYNEDIDTHTLETHIYSLRKKIEKKLYLKDLIIFTDNKGYFLKKEIL